jgi:hypothetical protein
MFDLQKTNQMHADAIVAILACVSVILFVAQIINEYKIQEIREIQQSVSGHIRQKRRQNCIWTRCLSGDETCHYGWMHDRTDAIIPSMCHRQENARGDVGNRACKVPVWIDGYACNQLDFETLRSNPKQIESVSVSDCRCVSVSGRQENGRVSVSEIGEEIEIAHAQIREIGRENAHVEIINHASPSGCNVRTERVSYMDNELKDDLIDACAQLLMILASDVSAFNPDDNTRNLPIRIRSVCDDIVNSQSNE